MPWEGNRMLRLYYFPGTCAFAPQVLLEEIAKPYELEVVVPASKLSGSPDLASSSDWRKVNPKGRVPALLGVAGSSGSTPELLTEVSAILYYLGRSNPELRLIPDGAAEQARCVEWMNYLASNLHAVALAQVSRGARFVTGEELYPNVAARGRVNALEGFAYVESVLADGRDWAVPGGFSIVDPYVTMFFDAGEKLFPDMGERHPAWARLAAKTHARPAMQRVVVREALALAEAREGRFHPRRTYYAEAATPVS
jgi:glutathione S-transferase